MGTTEDCNAAMAHRNMVYSQTNDAEQRSLADENVKRCQTRMNNDPANGGASSGWLGTLTKALGGK